MASTATLIVLFSIATHLSVPAAARPCKTLIITSTYSITLTRHPRSDPNPNPNFDSNFDAILSATSTFSQSNPGPSLYPSSTELERPNKPDEPRSSSGFGLFDVGPLHDRAKDFLIDFFVSLRSHAKYILAAVFLTLFVVASGAFVGMTIYLIWMLFAGIPVKDTESDGAYDAMESPKKMGYVTIPAADADLIPTPTKN